MLRQFPTPKSTYPPPGQRTIFEQSARRNTPVAGFTGDELVVVYAVNAGLREPQQVLRYIMVS